MGAPITRSPNRAIREVSRGLVQAPDEQIARVVAMVDAMPIRGQADQIIEPLRPRLARLRPPRPLRFARLLFMPLDPLIVPAARWRPGQPSVPRTIIPPLAAAVEAALGPLGRSIAATIEGQTTRDRAIVESAGVMLWRAAAGVLQDEAPPLDLETIGLTAQAYKPLARRIGVILWQAERLQQLASDAAQGLVPPESGIVQSLLTEALEHEAAVPAMLMALLLSRVPDALPVVARITAVLGQRAEILLRLAGDQAADILLEQLEAPGGAEAQLGGQDLAETGAALRRLSAFLSSLDRDPAPPRRRDRVMALRERIASNAQSLFAERLSADLLEPLRLCSLDPAADLEWELETGARGLRALETEARRIGGGMEYDTLLDQAADQVREVIARGGLGRSSGLRLMEILAGPERALALFGDDD